MDPNKQSLDKLKADVEMARAWAMHHFNANAQRDDLLSPPTFMVEFPDIDRMRVSPKVYGHVMDIWVDYRLAWLSNGQLAWKGTNPLTGAPLPLLRITVCQLPALDTAGESG